MRKYQQCFLESCISLYLLFFSGTAFAQFYGGEEYYPETEGPSTLEKILTSPAATLIVVLVGAAGLFNLFFSSEKGKRSDTQYVIAFASFILIILMCWYRFSLWNKK